MINHEFHEEDESGGNEVDVFGLKLADVCNNDGPILVVPAAKIKGPLVLDYKISTSM